MTKDYQNLAFFSFVYYCTCILTWLNLFKETTVVFRAVIPENATHDEIKSMWKFWTKVADLNQIPFCVDGRIENMRLKCDLPPVVTVVDFPDPPSRETSLSPSASPTMSPRYVPISILVDLREPILETPDFFIDAIERYWEPYAEISCICDDDDCIDHPLFSFWPEAARLDGHLPYPDVYITANMGENDTYWQWAQTIHSPVVIPEMPLVDEDVPCLRVVSGSAPELVQRMGRMFSDISNEPYYLNKGLDPFLDDVIDGYDQMNVIDAPREITPLCRKSVLFYIWADPSYICGEYDTKCWRDHLRRETEYINRFDEVVAVNLDTWIYRMSEVLPEIVVSLGRTGFDIKGKLQLSFFEMDYDVELDAVANWMEQNFIIQDFPNDLEITEMYEDLNTLTLF